jgi:uncharacterized repeat protein (TIGR03803 family)
MRILRRFIWLIANGCLAAGAAAVPGRAAAEGVIHRFQTQNDGQVGRSGLVNVGGVLFGTTDTGSATATGENDGFGTIFKVGQWGKETVLYSFKGGTDGYYPFSSLIGFGGMLYGTTVYGGNGFGTVFRITPAGDYKMLYAFTGGLDGANPYARLINVGGTLYGTTRKGGPASAGTVFKITPAGVESVVYAFKGGTDGAYPTGSLANVAGTLYGTTEQGGVGCGTHDCGTVFSLTLAGTEKVLYAFKGGTDGAVPFAGLLNVGGTLYGSTTEGGGTDCQGSGCGTLFKITPGGTYAQVHAFKGGTDGAVPYASLINVNGTLYGTAEQGGSTGCLGAGCGVVYKLTPDGKVTITYSFKGGTDGANPFGNLTFLNGALFGTTENGGVDPNFACCGVVYRMAP